MRYFSLYVDKKEGNLGWLPYLIYQLSSIQGSAKNIKSRVEIKHFSIVRTHESRLSPDSLWLLLDSRTRTRTLTHWTRTRTRTLVQWTRTRTRTLVKWTRTHTWWTRTLVLWTRTRTRTLALWTRTHCRTHESGLTPTLQHWTHYRKVVSSNPISAVASTLGPKRKIVSSKMDVMFPKRT